jgi:hypothetical protein
MSFNLDEESEKRFLDFVQQTVVAKANDLAGGIKSPSAMTPSS